MEINVLFEQNPWWKNKSLIEEDYDIQQWKDKKFHWAPAILEKISLELFALHIILGPRQVGKTTALKLLIRNLLERKDPNSLFYFNCENISDFKELTEVIELYLQFKDANAITNSIIMLDEITIPKEWYRSIKYCIDTGKLKRDVVIITGSSSIEIKKEVELFPGRRGKGKDFIIYPLSFRRFIEVIDQNLYKKLPIAQNIDEIEKKSLKALLFEKELQRHLEKYMEYGGFPLSISTFEKNKEEAKKAYLSWIKNTILKLERSDIIARQIIKVIIETIQTDISWEGISRKIEIKSPKTASAYVELFKSMFVINLLYNIDIQGRKIRFGKNKKIHIRDPLLFDIFEDWAMVNIKNKHSAIAESLVIEHISRLLPEKVFFWKNGFEIDAVILDKEKLYGLEVKWSEKPNAKSLPQLEKFIIVTKKDYSRNPLKIPLAVFLSLFDV